jgi:hypothetical protein
MRKWMLHSVVVVTLLIGASALLRAEDGIPDNCEAVAERSHLFVRYEPAAARLVLVDWRTGADALVLETGLTDTSGLLWSAECSYIVGAVNMGDHYDTVVWDALNGGRIGSVTGAQGRPHHLTWGPNGYLVVETQHGAILWYVPANTQLPLTTSFDPVSVRNFSRLRWDVRGGQLIANLAVGGRVVYDLATGAEAPYVANPVDSFPGELPETITIAGMEYPCLNGYGYGYRNWYSVNGYRPQGVFVRYSVTDQIVYLALDDIDAPDETLLVLDNVQAAWFRPRGWSANCRYVAVALGVPVDPDDPNPIDSSDTVIYDIIERRRVGVFPDARLIVHPLHWDDIGESVLIETREGAYLWHLPTDTRTLITPFVQTATEGSRDINSFLHVGWGGGILLLTPFDAPHEIRAYEGHTGARLFTLTTQSPVQGFQTSPGGRYVLVSDHEQGTNNTQGTHLTVWDLHTDTRLSITNLRSNYRNRFFSPDDHYLVAFTADYVDVWDLSQLSAAPTATYALSQTFYSTTFIDTVTLQTNEGARFNITTGAYTPPAETQPQVMNAVAGESGFSGISWRERGHINHQGNGYAYPLICGRAAVYDEVTRAVQMIDVRTFEVINTLEQNINLTTRLGLSADCRYAVGEVSVISNANPPYDDAPVDDVYRDRRTETLILWDTQTGERVGVFPHPYRAETYAGVWFSPGGERVLIRTTEGYFTLNLATRETQLLTYDCRGIGCFGQINSYPRVYWDYERGQILISGWGGALAFDMLTGIQRYEFSPDGCGYGGCYFAVRDGYIYVDGDDSLGVWNLNTLNGSVVDVRLNTAYIGQRAVISPDERYLVIVREMVRIWDLQTDQMLTFQIPNGRATAVHFTDNTTAEITTVSPDDVLLVDVTTGAILNR